jgi:hypothetical protein
MRAHHHDPIGKHNGFLDVMRHHDKRRLRIGPLVEQVILQVGAGEGIKRGERLMCEAEPTRSRTSMGSDLQSGMMFLRNAIPPYSQERGCEKPATGKTSNRRYIYSLERVFIAVNEKIPSNQQLEYRIIIHRRVRAQTMSPMAATLVPRYPVPAC